LINVSYAPVKIIFNKITGCTYTEVMAKIDKPLSKLGVKFLGDYQGLVKTNQLYKSLGIIHADYGRRPDVTNADQLDCIAYEGIVEWTGYIHKLTIFIFKTEQTSLELMVGFDSDEFLHDIGESWLAGFMSSLMMELNFESGLFDLEEYRIGQCSISTTVLINELRSEKFKIIQSPRLSIVHSRSIDPIDWIVIRQNNCSVMEIEGGYTSISWL